MKVSLQAKGGTLVSCFFMGCYALECRVQAKWKLKPVDLCVALTKL